MIHVERPADSAPDGLASRAAEERAAAQAHHAAGRHHADRFSFRAYRHPSVKHALRELFDGTCAYCESAIGATAELVVEHHRPKAGALNLDGAVSPDHYWWLAGEWANLLPTCGLCNRSKRTRFPVTGERALPGTTGAALAAEGPLLLDPCVDNPAEHLVFREDGVVVSGTPRGIATIDVLGLNRGGLVAARRNAAAALLADLSLTDWSEPAMAAHALEQIQHHLSPAREYAAMRRQFIRRRLAGLSLATVPPELRGPLADAMRVATVVADLVTDEKEQVATRVAEAHKVKQRRYSVEADAAEDKEAFFSGGKWIEWIRIENFKAIERMELRFPRPRTARESWLMLVGENGTGKSSVLRAVALALMGERHARDLELDAAEFVRRGSRRGWGRVQVKLATLPEAIEVRFSRGSPRFRYTAVEPKVLLLGYGATRILRRHPQGADAGPPHVRIENLFDPTAPLSDVESWMLDTTRVDDERFASICAALADLLMLDPRDRFVRSRGRIEVVLRDEVPVGLAELSDGFQSVVALCADVMKSLLERFPQMEEAEGIVLLDEIEAHLHPTWKIQIVERLRRTFPRVSFLVSTHDPLCLKGLESGEIVVLTRDEERRIRVLTDVPPVNDWRADQILTSPLFGLHSTRGEAATTGLIGRYADLYGKRHRRPEEEDELQRLRERLERTLTTQESPLQRDVEETVRAAIRQAPVGVDADATGNPSPEQLELRRQFDAMLEDTTT